MSAPNSTSEEEQLVSPCSPDKSTGSTSTSPFDYAPEVDKSAQAPELNHSFPADLQTIRYGDDIEVLPSSITRGAPDETNEKPGKRRSYFKIAFIVAAVIIAVVVALSVGLTLGLRKTPEQGNQPQPTTPPNSTSPSGPTSTPPPAPTKNGVMNDTSIAGLSSPATDYLFYQDVNGNLRVGAYSQSQGIFNFEQEPIQITKMARNNTPLAMVSLTKPTTQDNLQFLCYVTSDNMLAIFGFDENSNNITVGKNYLIGDYPVSTEGRRISATPRSGINNSSMMSLYVFFEAPEGSITALSGTLDLVNFNSSWHDVSATFFSNAPNVSSSTPFDIVYSFDNTTGPAIDIGLHGAFFNPASISDPKAPLYSNAYLNGSADENLPRLNFTYSSQPSSPFPSNRTSSLRDTDWLLFSFEPDGSDNRVAVIFNEKMYFLGWDVAPPNTTMPFSRMIFTNEANNEYTIYSQLNESVLMAHTLVSPDVGWTSFNITVPYS